MTGTITKTSWRDRTKHLLLHRPASLTIKKISEDTKISEAWIRLFARGKIDNPGVNSVQTLNAYLKKHLPKQTKKG